MTDRGRVADWSVLRKKSLNSFPKNGYSGRRDVAILTLDGSIHLEWKRCGKPNCRCARGLLHGPYFYRRWRERGRLRKGYVSREQVVSAILAITLRRQMQDEVQSIRSSTKRSRAKEAMR